MPRKPKTDPPVQAVPAPPAPLPDQTPDTPEVGTPPIYLPDHPQYIPPPVEVPMPKPSFIDNIASRTLFEVRSFLSALFWLVGLILAQFFGIDNANLNDWIGPDKAAQVSELWSFFMFFVTTYFIKNRKPGAVEGVIRSPGVMTVTNLSTTKMSKSLVKPPRGGE